MYATNSLRMTWGESPVMVHNGFPIHLTPRQREVLLLLCSGLPNKLIGRQLGLSDATVKCHVASVLRSLNVSTRLEAVAAAFQLGLVRPSIGGEGGMNGASLGALGLGNAMPA